MSLWWSRNRKGVISPYVLILVTIAILSPPFYTFRGHHHRRKIFLISIIVFSILSFSIDNLL